MNRDNKKIITSAWYNGYPIYIATEEHQRRKHHKKRINKKWRKKYGVVEHNSMPHGKVVILDKALFMTKRTFEQLQQIMGNENILGC